MPKSDTVTGRWEYLGDRRVKVTLDGEFSAENYGETYNGIGKSFVVYIDTNGYGYRNLEEYTKDSVDASGRSELVVYLEPGQTGDMKLQSEELDDGGQPYEVDPQRGIVFVGLDPSGGCIGAGKPLEGRNSFTFGESGNTPADDASWYGNPVDARGTDTSLRYDRVEGADWDKCVADNENANSTSYNNESLFYDCLDGYQTAAGDVDAPGEEERSDVSTDEGMQESAAMACARQYGLNAKYSDQTGQVTLTNGAAYYIDVQKVGSGDGGTTGPDQFYLESNHSSEFESARSVVYVALDLGRQLHRRLYAKGGPQQPHLWSGKLMPVARQWILECPRLCDLVRKSAAMCSRRR
ncbi:hypothetical protein OEG84_05690 [Hoeflea sp. G2-23]|uniref:Uncharacterized protein n=1 Tax=Hoeflea algicola TaxID=2983763 RepID=A0ABT3Z7E4_9HYPH|nr:hypothetical protein [Hoeflea algicola]MCY0147216.1 hypothetical protein [Hoeflea algicola]